MRTWLTVLAVSAFTSWTMSARAQLQPPPPMTAPAPAWPQLTNPWAAPAQPAPLAPNATTQQLNAADASGSFRGLEIAYVDAEAGGGYTSFGKTLGGGKSGEGGAAFGVAAGARFITWTLGAHLRLMPLSDFTLIQATLEAGYHLPMGAWDPYLNIHGGYAVASAKSSEAGLSIPSPHGFDLGLSIGDDYYFSALFSVGIDATFDTMFLSRAAFTGQTSTANPPIIVETSIPSASGVGVDVIGSVHAGLHFDL